MKIYPVFKSPQHRSFTVILVLNTFGIVRRVSVAETRYNEIRSHQISKALYLRLDVFGQFEARVPEFDAMFSVQSPDF
jgi:hypothetical protein